MTRFERYILSPVTFEAAYPGNIGFMEMAQFYQVATERQIKKMEEIIKNEDWEGFKTMIERVLKTKLF